MFHIFESDELLLEGGELLDGLVELSVALLGSDGCLWNFVLGIIGGFAGGFLFDLLKKNYH